MNECPDVSIITPSYNQGKFIEATLRSIIAQQYPRLEHIVVDGGSTDETIEILKKYESAYPLRWISEPDEGQSDAINKGIRMARGEIVSWINSDDLMFEGGVSAVVRAFAEHPDAGLVYGTGAKIDIDGKILSMLPFRPMDTFELRHALRFLQPSAFFKRKLFLDIGGLDKALNYAMDWDLFIRMSRVARFVSIPDPVGMYRTYAATKTSSGGWNKDRELAAIGRRHNGVFDRNNLSFCVRAVAGRLVKSAWIRAMMEHQMSRWWGDGGYAVRNWPD